MPTTEKEAEEGAYYMKVGKAAHGYLKEIDKQFGKFVNLWNKRFAAKRVAGLDEDMYRTLQKIKPLLHRLKILDAQGDKYFIKETAKPK